MRNKKKVVSGIIFVVVGLIVVIISVVLLGNKVSQNTIDHELFVFNKTIFGYTADPFDPSLSGVDTIQTPYVTLVSNKTEYDAFMQGDVGKKYMPRDDEYNFGEFQIKYDNSWFSEHQLVVVMTYGDLNDYTVQNVSTGKSQSMTFRKVVDMSKIVSGRPDVENLYMYDILFVELPAETFTTDSEVAVNFDVKYINE